MTPKWVPIAAVIVIHDRQIARHGGAPGIRDRGLIETGLARPINRHGFSESDLFVLAANYAFGISKAHAFVDGNKRTAIVTAVTFLALNGIGFSAPPNEVVRYMEDLAASVVSEDEFAEWLRRRRTKGGP